jgi:hypothetical protein
MPFPTRISLQKTLLFTLLVFIAQQVEHTDLAFSTLFCAYVIITVLAFNYAGGFSRASGSYIFWFGLLTCILGGLWKIVLGEPADSNLLVPTLTLATYVVSMGVMIMALFITKRVVGKPRGLSPVLHADKVNLGVASLGCLMAYELAANSTRFLPGGNGSISSIIVQLNVFLPMAILIGTIHAIRSSGGKRSVNVVTFVASTQMFIFYGLMNFSKQGMFTPFICWGIAAASQRYRLRFWQILLLVGISVYSVMVLSPLSQVTRAIAPPGEGYMDAFRLSTDLLMHPVRLRQMYKDSLGITEAAPGETPSFAAGYFNQPQGLLDRLSIIKSDDRLVNYTAQGHTEGSFRAVYYFIDWIPHFILPDKEKLVPPGITNPGNYYAHEIGGLLSPDDFSTGISFSSTAEAFHLNEWLGIIVVGGFVWTLLFISVEIVCGDLRQSPYGLLAMVAFAHAAPESLIGGLIYFIFFQNLGIVVAIVFCSYFAPILGALLAGNPTMRRYGSRPSLRVETAGI